MSNLWKVDFWALRACSDQCLAPIQMAMATMATFSVNETKPSGTLLLPPTHALSW